MLPVLWIIVISLKELIILLGIWLIICVDCMTVHDSYNGSIFYIDDTLSWIVIVFLYNDYIYEGKSGYTAKVIYNTYSYTGL
ncbi:hypothetical protein GCM10023188_39810 [Pontibacter saemangeumensis]|uniref:Uncharacterized protein n=1 Tax=Pontibacter saemangeumensis TaxID=1084525 RepID=A0ABP8M0J2_9BACT